MCPKRIHEVCNQLKDTNTSCVTTGRRLQHQLYHRNHNRKTTPTQQNDNTTPVVPQQSQPGDNGRTSSVTSATIGRQQQHQLFYNNRCRKTTPTPVGHNHHNWRTTTTPVVSQQPNWKTTPTLRTWSTMECSQLAAWTSNRSLLVSKPFPEDQRIRLDHERLRT